MSLSVRAFVSPDKCSCPGLSGLSGDPYAIVPNVNDFKALPAVRHLRPHIPSKYTCVIVNGSDQTTRRQ